MEQNAFDMMKSKINKGITTVSLKTSSSVEKAKINTYIESLNGDIESLKKEMGEKVYKLWEYNQFDLEKLTYELNTIKEKNMKIAELKDQLLAIEDRENDILGKGVIVGCKCAQCGTQYEQKINFCVKCGAKL